MHMQDDAAVPVGDTADHIAEARQKACRMLAGESHVGNVDDVRQALIRARDGVLLTWAVWVALDAFQVETEVGGLLIAFAAGMALLLGLTTGIATLTQLRYYESELERERNEIRDMPEHERDELRELYAAKGFRPPLLDQIVDTLCADDDRLLKVMMEEELGLFFHNVNHPVLVGVWNAAGALVAALLLAIPVCYLDAAATRWWMPIGGTVLLALLACIRGRATQRIIPTLASWIVVGLVTGGVVHFVGRTFAGG